MTNILSIAFSIICTIESCNGKYMVNEKDTTCVGWVGLRPIAVDDCNRIVGEQRYTLNDRYDLQKCREMFTLIVNKYLPKNPTMSQIARLWCRGRNRMYAPETQTVRDYLRKAKELYDASTSMAGTNPNGDAGKTGKAKSSHTRSQRGRG